MPQAAYHPPFQVGYHLKSQLKSPQKNSKKENDIELYLDVKASDSSLKLNLNHESNESHTKEPLNTLGRSQCFGN